MENKKARPKLLILILWLCQTFIAIIGLMEAVQSKAKIVWKEPFETTKNYYKTHISIPVKGIQKDILNYVQQELKLNISWIPDWLLEWLPVYIPIASVFFIGFSFSYFYIKNTTIFHFLYDFIKELLAEFRKNFFGGIMMIVFLLLYLIAFYFICPVFFIVIPLVIIGLLCLCVYIYISLIALVLKYAILISIAILAIWYFINKTHLKETIKRNYSQLVAFLRSMKVKAPIVLRNAINQSKQTLNDKDSSFNTELRFWLQLIKIQYQIAFAIGFIFIIIIIINNRVLIQ